MKKFIIVLALLAMVLSSAFAKVALEDRAGVLNEKEKDDLIYRMESASSETGISLGILTDNGTGNKSEEAFTDDWYDSVIDEDDGVALFLDYSGRSAYISTCGYGMYVVDDYGEDIVFDNIIDYLKNDEWYRAFKTFVIMVSELAEDAPRSDYENTVYDIRTGNFEVVEEDKGFNVVMVIVGFLAVGLIGSLIYVAVLKAKLKSEGLVDNADAYVVPDSFGLDSSHDIYLYSTVTKRIKPQSSSSSGRSSSGHRSSSGRVHGGGGRKF